MALLCSRLVSKAFKRQLAVPCRFYAITENLPDPMELATGAEKFEKTHLKTGNLDPFKEEPIQRIPNSTKDNPNPVYSYFDCRVIACSCTSDSASLIYMWVFKGEPRRCRCGHWFKLQPYKV